MAVKLASLTEIKSVIRSLSVFDGTAAIWTATRYFMPELEWFTAKLAPAIQAEFLKYKPAENRRDCNQAVRIALALAGNAMAKRPENAAIAVGRTVGGLYSELNGIKSDDGAQHDTCLVVMEGFNPYFYEPQNSRITHAENVTLGDWAASVVEL
jgi:hypothetical protein